MRVKQLSDLFRHDQRGIPLGYHLGVPVTKIQPSSRAFEWYYFIYLSAFGEEGDIGGEIDKQSPARLSEVPPVCP